MATVVVVYYIQYVTVNRKQYHFNRLLHKEVFPTNIETNQYQK